MKIFDKPFFSSSDLLERLINEYNLNSVDRKLEIKLLETISYYDLINRYKDSFSVCHLKF